MTYEPMRFCTADPARIVIDANAPIEIAGVGGERRRFAFSRGHTSWGSFELWERPTSAPSGPYIFDLEEPDVDLSVTIIPLRSMPNSVMEAAELLASNGCSHQLQYLSDWLDDAVYEPGQARSNAPELPEGPDSGWVQNNHFDCLIVEPVAFMERAYQDEEPCSASASPSEVESL